MSARAAAMVAAAAGVVVLGAVGCGKGTSAEKREAPGTASGAASASAAPSETAHGSAPASGSGIAVGSKPAPPTPAPWWADRPDPALKALGAALEQVDPRAVQEWLRMRELPSPEGEPPIPPPAAVQTAIDALVAWDGSGGVVPMPCTNRLGDGIPYHLLMTVKAAFEVSSGPSDPPAHAALRMALVLRADDNDPMAIGMGAAIPTYAAETFARRGVPAAIPAPFMVAEDLPWRVLAATARCTDHIFETFDATTPENAELMAGLAKLGHKPEQQLAEEARMVHAFWAETLAQAAKVKTRAALGVLLDRRIEEARAMQPRSLLTPTLGAPYAARMLVRNDAPAIGAAP
jgi:hypothetical protein